MISVIVPIYNVKQYILKCLDSICNQTFHGEIECILVDDCGNDDSIKIAKEYIKEYQGGIHFRIIHHDNNKGVGEARNTGIREAHGEFIFFLDSDDSLKPDCMLLLVKKITEYPDTEVVFAGSTDTNGYEYLCDTPFELPEYTDNKEWIRKVLCMKYLSGTVVWNKLIRKDFLIKNALFFVNERVHEDEIWLFKLSLCINRIAIVKTSTYNYTLRDNGLTRLPIMPNQKAEEYIIMWQTWLHYLGDKYDNCHIQMIWKDILEYNIHCPSAFKMKIRKLLFELFLKASWNLKIYIMLTLPLIKTKTLMTLGIIQNSLRIKI